MHRYSQILRITVSSCWFFALVFAYTTSTSVAGSSSVSATATPTCKVLDKPKDLLSGQQSDLAVVQQGYNCLLSHYISGKKLDDRILIKGTVSSLTQQLGDLASGIVLPPLSGNHLTDWQAFATVYRAFAVRLSSAVDVQRSLAQASLYAMATTLHDDHTSYLPPEYMKPALLELTDNAPIPTFGLITSPITDTTSQIFITDVFSSTPAANAALRPGDIIQQVNADTAIVRGVPSQGLLSVLLPQMGVPVHLTILRPSTGTQLSVTLTPRLLLTPATTAHIVHGDIAYVKLYEFTTNASDQVFKAIHTLGLGTHMQGVILDLRGDGGGASDQAVRIISAFVHHAVVAVEIDGDGHRSPQHTDDKVPLLGVPLAVLVDGGSASSSEVVAAAVRDLHLGTVIGTRSAGALAGAEFFGLSDGSGIEITEVRVLGALSEKVDGVGVTPAKRQSATAEQLSASQDPVINVAIKALVSSEHAPLSKENG